MTTHSGGKIYFVPVSPDGVRERHRANNQHHQKENGLSAWQRSIAASDSNPLKSETPQTQLSRGASVEQPYPKVLLTISLVAGRLHVYGTDVLPGKRSNFHLQFK